MASRVQQAPIERLSVRQVTVGTTAVRLDSTAMESRREIVLRQLKASTGLIYWGPGSTVSASNGFQMEASDVIGIEASTRVTLWAIASIANQKLAVAELA